MLLLIDSELQARAVGEIEQQIRRTSVCSLSASDSIQAWAKRQFDEAAGSVMMQINQDSLTATGARRSHVPTAERPSDDCDYLKRGLIVLLTMGRGISWETGEKIVDGLLTQ